MYSAVIHTYLMLISVANGFNLSPKYAIIFDNPGGELNKNYFGYTVALQREHFGYEVTSRVVVGAPRSNSTWRLQASIMEPGAVFQCPVTSSGGTCTPIMLDPRGNIKNEYQAGNRVYKYQDRKDNAWVGGAMDVQDHDGGIVVCGPRWSNQLKATSYYFMNGICYWKNESFSSNANAVIKLPLIDGDFQIRTDPSGKDSSFYYGLGAAGMSTHLTKDGKEMLIGAPGFLWMTGTVIRYSAPDSDAIVNNRRRRQARPDDFQKVVVPNPYIPGKLGFHGYIGYSLDSGIFLKATPNKTYYVSGAPRGDDLKGLVLVFDFPNNNDETLKLLTTLVGRQLGEYFGSAVCVVDLNGDGLDDVVVGAPMHSVVNSRGSRQHSGDEGRAYVFINKDKRLLQEIGDTNIITGSTAQGSRFGTSIAKIGDINMDGLQDIAIGAPNEDGGKGSIYIYHGHKSGIQPKYSQRITASDFPRAVISGFGISISRGLDIDGNHYNDIAVGAYTSGHVVIIRSRPVISFQPQLRSDVEKIGINATEFSAIACLTYTGKYAPSTVDARIMLHVSSFDGRAFFISNATNATTRTYSYNVTVNENDFGNCHNIQVHITKGKRQDYTKPIELRMEYQLLSKETIENVDAHTNSNDGFLKTSAVVDPAAISYITQKVPYVTGCRDESVCHTDLVVNAAFEDVTPPFIIGKQSSLRIKVSVKNTGESAFLVKVNITLPSATPLSRLPEECQEVTSQDPGTSQETQLECDVMNPLQTDVETSFILELATSGLSESSEELQYIFRATSVGNDTKPDDNTQLLRLPLESVADISITGSSSPNLVYSNTSHTLIHTYEVRNDGPSPVNLLFLEIQIPVTVVTSSGPLTFVSVYEPTSAFVLYTVERQPFACTSPLGHSFISDEERDSSGSEGDSQQREGIVVRKKRTTDSIDKDTVTGIVDQDMVFNETLFANCSNKNIQCMTVSCIVGPFLSTQSVAVLSLRMRANLTTLGPLLQKKNILISTTGLVKMANPNIKQPLMDTPDNFTVTTMFYGRPPKESLAWWILALAIAGGLLLLFVIAYVFYKVGFFKREKKDELENLKVNDAIEEELGVINTEIDEMDENIKPTNDAQKPES